MKRLNRPIIAWIFVLLLLAPAAWTAWTRFQQSAIRDRMEERLEAALLQEHLISNSQLRWVRVGKELILQGKLFDVKRTETLPNGVVRVWGLYDEEEQVLMQQIQKRQEEREKEQRSQLIQLLQMPQAIHNTHFTTECPVHGHHGCPTRRYSASLSAGNRRIPTPPPQG